MYKVILDSLLDEMQNFGLISTIVISGDYYITITDKERQHLESLLDMNSSFKWMLVNDKKEYFSFVFSIEPCGIL